MEREWTGESRGRRGLSAPAGRGHRMAGESPGVVRDRNVEPRSPASPRRHQQTGSCACSCRQCRDRGEGAREQPGGLQEAGATSTARGGAQHILVLKAGNCPPEPVPGMMPSTDGGKVRPESHRGQAGEFAAGRSTQQAARAAHWVLRPSHRRTGRGSQPPVGRPGGCSPASHVCDGSE